MVAMLKYCHREFCDIDLIIAIGILEVELIYCN